MPKYVIVHHMCVHSKLTKMMLFLVLCVTAVLADPRVTLDKGVILGKTLQSREGRNILAFQGIPYAAPPVGNLKFKPPQEVSEWTEERNAQHEASTCSQINYLTKQYEGSDDCLYVNVYTPKLEGTDLDVMVWVHGGGFFSGSGNTDLYGPNLLLDRDVVLVTMNYRLGVQGFFSLGSNEAPGNFGLKDQVAALRWVRDNVAKFGGNSNSVTIFGESAGGASVHYLMLSTSARGLFHRAIVQSGSAHNDWAFQRNPASIGRSFAKRLGCEGDDPSIIECLRALDGRQLAQNEHDMMKEMKRDTLFSPTTEPADAEGVFLSEEPRTLLARGDISDVPLIVGLMTHEGLYHLNSVLRLNKTTEEELNTNYARYVPEDLELQRDSEEYVKVWNKIKQFYQDLYPNNPNEVYVMLNTDAEFVPGVDDFTRGFAALKRSSVYYYQFSYDGELNFLKKIMHINYPGTCHADELSYLFSGSMYPSLETAKPTDLVTIERITKLWTNFAKTGNPTPDNEFGVQWIAVESPLNTPDLATTRYFDINDNLIMREDNLNSDRVIFWRNLRKEYKNDV